MVRTLGLDSRNSIATSKKPISPLDSRYLKSISEVYVRSRMISSSHKKEDDCSNPELLHRNEQDTNYLLYEEMCGFPLFFWCLLAAFSNFELDDLVMTLDLSSLLYFHHATQTCVRNGVASWSERIGPVYNVPFNRGPNQRTHDITRMKQSRYARNVKDQHYLNLVCTLPGLQSLDIWLSICLGPFRRNRHRHIGAFWVLMVVSHLLLAFGRVSVLVWIDSPQLERR
ncbi:hypothetical protein GGS21DRAFT_41276 [Xylaria nigripes]|nr:hypothetical protein GGS21DRAFT_41276 [Xylaria nigripes]